MRKRSLRRRSESFQLKRGKVLNSVWEAGAAALRVPGQPTRSTASIAIHTARLVLRRSLFRNYSALLWLRAPASGSIRGRMSATRWRSQPRRNNYVCASSWMNPIGQVAANFRVRLVKRCTDARRVFGNDTFGFRRTIADSPRFTSAKPVPETPPP
jgi:hypothetical protein